MSALEVGGFAVVVRHTGEVAEVAIVASDTSATAATTEI